MTSGAILWRNGRSYIPWRIKGATFCFWKAWIEGFDCHSRCIMKFHFAMLVQNNIQTMFFPLFNTGVQNMIHIFWITSVSTYQYGVPTKELAGEAMEAEPKSASLTCPGSVSRMLPAFTSLIKRKEGKQRVGDIDRHCDEPSHIRKNVSSRANSIYSMSHARKKLKKMAPVDHVVGVKVGQSLQGAVSYSSNLHFL